MYYRYHHSQKPFSPENAYSAPWGCGPNGECPLCDGDVEDCPACRGTGYVELRRGYSCCDTPEALVHYFESRGGVGDEDAPLVVEFSGYESGEHGADLETLVIPDMKHVRWMSWKELKALTKGGRENDSYPGDSR